MCTVTILRTRDMLRVACNRDESRRRPMAYAPYIRRAGSTLALAPEDALAHGTWIGANAAGLVFTLLNLRSGRRARDPGPSRGLVIPALLDCESPADASRRLPQILPANVAPFRLLVSDATDALEHIVIDGWIERRSHPLTAPLLFTSSSLGDALVEGPRRHLFEQMFETPCPSTSLGARDPAATQDAYHEHRWRDQPAVSVNMSRPDACTVSTTIVEVTASHVRMLYAQAHCDAGVPAGLIIDRQPVVRDEAELLAVRMRAS